MPLGRPWVHAGHGSSFPPMPVQLVVVPGAADFATATPVVAIIEVAINAMPARPTTAIRRTPMCPSEESCGRVECGSAVDVIVRGSQKETRGPNRRYTRAGATG